MKTLRNIVLFGLLLLSQTIVAGTELISRDKYWLGGTDRFNTTEGNDFWLTFMNNNMFDPDKPENATVKFEMNVILSAQEDVTVIIATSQGKIGQVAVPAGRTVEYKIDRKKAEEIYLIESEEKSATKYGVHVYSAPTSPENKKKVFSCFLYNRACESPVTSRDASLVIPTRFLGKEYIIQTYPEDVYSSEFAIVAAEDNTIVTITPTFETDGGHAKDASFDVTLAKGQAYLVASKRREEGSTEFVVDLSGSRICADKPVAVFNGNQQTGIPNKEGYSQDFMVEQAIPVSQWGTEFYLSGLTNTKSNYVYVTALENGTNVQVYINGNTPLSFNLNSGQTMQPIQLNDETRKEVIIKATKPVVCYDYLTTAAENKICVSTGLSDDCYIYGDPANAMMPSWQLKVPSMTLYTGALDPQGGTSTPQHFYAYVVTKTADIGKFKLNGASVAASTFNKFQADATMAYAHIELPDASISPYNLLETTGEGFVGMVYGLTEAQAYFYTLGFQPLFYGDSIYVSNSQEVTMSKGSYDMDSLDGHGWYQRQWDEWMEEKERLDTAVVCDSSFVAWTVETPKERPIEQIDWTIYEVTDGKKAGQNAPIESSKTDKPASGEKHKYGYQFILPEETPEKRHQFFEYEIQAVLHRTRTMCDGEDIDTLKTTVRVTRVYNDTVYRVVCVGDTLSFFYDSLYNQSDLSQFSPDSAATKFVGVKKGQGTKYLKPWHYQVEVSNDTLCFPRHYLSQAGCDSTIILVLMVCDTFQYYETIHLCSNQDTVCHGRTIRGSSYAQSETVDIDIPFKAQTCACQLSDLADKFRDKNGKPFKGCDSIYHIHLIVHPSWFIRERDTVCLTPDGKGSYDWKIQYGTKTRTITQDDLTWSAADGALKGVFLDSMYTRTCKECNNGQHGCDSVHELTLIMPKSYYFTETEEWCKLKYNTAKHDTVHEYFKWYGHMEGAPYIELKTGGTYYDNCKTKRYQCDSIYELNLTYKTAKEVYKLVVDTICLDTSVVYKEWTDIYGNIIESFPLKNFSIPKNKPCTTIYRHDDSRCDTVYAMHLTLMPKYYLVTNKQISEEEVYKWDVTGMTYGGAKTELPHDTTVTEDVTIVRKFETHLGTKSCDSIHVLELRIGSVFRDTTHDFACGEDKRYEWHGIDHDGNDSIRKIIPESQLPKPGEYKWFTDEHKTSQGFDSVYYLHLYRAKNYAVTEDAYECQQKSYDVTFTWKGHEGRTIYNRAGNTPVPFIPLTWEGDFYYIDTMKTHDYGCDSICTLHLHVYPYYDLQAPSQKVCQGERFVWEELPGNTKPDSILNEDGIKIASIPTDHTGDYSYTLKFHSVNDCDSTMHLKLHIDTVYRVPVETTERSMCDNDTIHFLGKIIYGVNSPLKPEGETGISVPEGKRWLVFQEEGVTPSAQNCDSAVHHQITLYKTYFFPETDHVCQGTKYTWHQQELPTDKCGTFVFYDAHDTEFGCDSTYELTLRVDSVYHIHEKYTLCDNDTMSWQGRFYRGEKFQGTAAEMAKYKEVKSDTTYGDTVAIGTMYTGCDSTYYLLLRVAPTYIHTFTFNVCDNDSSDEAHIYEFRDKQGLLIRDTIAFAPTFNHPDGKRDREGIKKEDIAVDTTHMLKTIEGCDSLVTYHIVIHPTYKFVESDKGCAGYTISWRDMEISGTGTYYLHEKTHDEWQCDSVYELDFYVKPFITVPMYDQVCDNHSYYHRDTVGETIFESLLWWPGAVRPDTTYVRFKGSDGCDSLVYEYHLDICPTYQFSTDTNGLCLGKPVEYTFESSKGPITHVWHGPAYEFDVDTFVLPFDTVFIDSLQTHRGCDSVFVLNAHAFPSYRHIMYDTICANKTYTWVARDERPDSVLADLEPGIHFLRDSFLTLDGCDSIYETQLCVNPNYISVDSLTLCTDETLQWRDHFYEHMRPGNYFEADNLTTDRGCDSIYHLYLTVIDTTYEVRYDSICIGDTLTITETGHFYTQAGDYKDTAYNAEGCRHFIYTHLTVIPPTVPKVWANDPMCPSETAFDMFYTYTSHKPIAYSLYFDSIGLSMGFEDMVDIPISVYTDPMVITVPIPYRGNDPTQYPRPNNYSVRLVLDNGICQHKETDCFHDSTFMMSYPKWITEQRFGDVIAILNETLNGGYIWDEYQWFQGNQALPGQTQPYLYIPTGLEVGAEYHVELTRQGEKEKFPTCPITITSDPINNKYAPTMGYLSVVPTCVTLSHPYINILSRKDGTYRITTTDGVMVKEGTFHADATEVQIPATAGMYIVQLWSYDTPEEPYRAIKIVLRDKCDLCATSF